MAHHHSPRIVTDNLVFYYDTGNVLKSYKGEPTTNYVPGTYDYSLYAYASGPVNTTATNENKKVVDVKRYTITNAVNTARAAIYPTTNTSDYYTFSFKWRYNGTVTTSPSIGITAFKGNPEGGANNNSFGYERADTVAIGNNWYLTTYTFRFSSNPTGKCMLTFGITTGSNTAYVGETFDIYEAQFEVKDHRTSYASGTRSSTQGLIDLIGNHTVNIDGVTFDANSQITFDGTNDYISLSPVPDINQRNYSLEAVVYRASTGATHGIWSDAQYGFFGVYISSANVVRFRHMTNPTYASTDLGGSTTIGVGTYHIVNTYNTSTGFRTYVNGVLDASTTATTAFTLSSGRGINKLGVYEDGAPSNANSLNGKIHLAKVYHKTLTAAEVAQNYQAVKSRFGI